LGEEAIARIAKNKNRFAKIIKIGVKIRKFLSKFFNCKK
jgi:hypothetical protein